MNSRDHAYDEANVGNYSRNCTGTTDGYYDGHSESPLSPGEPDTHESSQSPPISQHHSNVDYDDESQYSLPEFSHIHLDGENDHQNRTFGSLVHAGQFTKLLLPLTGPTTFTTDTSSVAGVADNTTTNRKRAFSFAASVDGASSSTCSNALLTGITNPTMEAINEGSSTSVNNNHHNNNGFPSEKQRTATKICRVCGDKAFSYNFNVITCESCKAFFRRNANKEKEIRCPFNDSCDINMVSRRFCQRCRLHKCFRVGMKKEWIMSEEARLEKKQRIHDNRQKRIAERKRRSGSAEAFSNAIKASTLSAAGGNTSNGQLASATTASDNANSDIAPPAEKLLNTDSVILIENNSTNALLTSTVTAAAGVAASVDQPTPVQALIDATTLAGLPTALQLSNVTKLAASATNSGGTPSIASETVVIQPILPTLPLLPSLINNERRPSADILAAVVSNNLVQLNSAQQQLQQQQLQQQQQQLQQPQLQQQQSQQQEQKLEPMDHEPSAKISSQSIISPAMDQQSFGKLASQSQQSSAQQMEQLSLIGIGINPTSITATTTMCPTFCATNTNIPAACISQSESTSQPSPLISPTDATLAAAAAVAAVAASQPLILNNTATQPTANIAAAVQVAQLQNLEQQQQRLLHQQQQQAAAAVIQQQLQNQQVIVVSNQQQLLAVQQQHHQQQLEQQKLAAAVASCLQPQTITTAVDIAAAAMAATQPTQTLNQPPDPSQFMDPTTAAAAAVGMIPQTVSVVPSSPSALMTTIQPLKQLQQQQQQANLLPKLIETAAAVSASHQRNSQEMVSVPKDVLIKLVEHKIESDQQQADAKPAKCQCRCQCGRYPSEMLIVDKVMTDLLDNSSKSCCESSRRNSVYHACGEHALSSTGGKGSTINTPPTYALTAAAAQASSFYPSSSTAIKIQPAGNTVNSVSFEAAFNSDLEINADYCKMALGDEENLQELLRANGIWNSEPGETQFGVTESGLRRLIRTISSFATFRSLDRHDQTLLLKHGCENYFALRGATSFNEEKIPLLIQNGVSENLIGFYRDFEMKFRSNETIILLLCMILLFNPDIPELNNRPLVTMESIKYQSILKRLLYALCGENIQEAAKTFIHLMAKLDQLKAIATICPLDSVEPIVQRVFDPSAIMSTTFNAIFQDPTNAPMAASITNGPTTTITTGYV